MKLYSYVVARDFGFAPNPFHGFCTLATCKPRIRSTASVGDWIIGTGSKSYGIDGHLVYAMHVSEKVSFDEYWADDRFEKKRPNMSGGICQAFGDNIYHRDSQSGEWLQENSHHSLADGSQNSDNTQHDTQVENVLVSNAFWFWGASGPKIPAKFRGFDGHDICLSGRGHKWDIPNELRDSMIEWILASEKSGFLGDPAEFANLVQSYRC